MSTAARHKYDSLNHGLIGYESLIQFHFSCTLAFHLQRKFATERWERGNSAILARAERGPLVRRAEEEAWSRASELLLLDAIQCAKANLDPTSVP